MSIITDVATANEVEITIPQPNPTIPILLTIVTWLGFASVFGGVLRPLYITAVHTPIHLILLIGATVFCIGLPTRWVLRRSITHIRNKNIVMILTMRFDNIVIRDDIVTARNKEGGQFARYQLVRLQRWSNNLNFRLIREAP